MNMLKDLLGQFLKYFEFVGENEWETGFRCGAFFAVATILILVVLLLLLRFIFFRKRQIRQLTLDAPKGKYVISASAIADLLSAKIKEFNEVTLLKTRIYPVRGGKCRIVLYINLVPNGNPINVPELISRIQEESLALLSDVFGVTTVANVSVCINRAKQKS